MRSDPPRAVARLGRAARPTILFFAAAAAVSLLDTSRATAVETLVYSFEDDLQGWTNNPSSTLITVTQDTIGATNGTHSMKLDVDSAATFEGALTTTFDPTVLGDPPGVDYVLFDMTLTQAYPVPPATGFGRIGVSVFGMSHTNPPVFLQAQFADEEPIDGKAAGTYRDIRIDLTQSVGPFGTGKSFDQIFGDSPTELSVTGFELYINKTASDSDNALTVYIDNIRLGRVVAGVPGDYNGNGVVDAADYVLWRNGGPLMNEVADPGTVSPADYTEWKARFGNTSGSGVSVNVVPEPVTGMLLLVASAMGLAVLRRPAGR